MIIHKAKIITLTLCLFQTLAFSQNGFDQALSLYRSGKSSEALQAFKTLSSTDAQNDKIFFYLGNLYMQVSNVTQAEIHFQKALELNRNEAVYYYNVGAIQSYNGLDEVAQALYEQAIKLDPNYALPHEKLARLSYSEGKYSQTVRHLKQVLILEPAHPQRATIQALIQRLSQKPDLNSQAGNENNNQNQNNNNNSNNDSAETDSGKIPITLDLSDIGEQKELESPDEESIKDIDIELEILD